MEICVWMYTPLNYKYNHSIQVGNGTFPLIFSLPPPSPPLQYYREIDMLTDAQRIERIKYLVDNGFSDKIVVGQDIHTKHVLVRKSNFH
jgi:hypothetical protein